jgi:hypothetical protein
LAQAPIISRASGRAAWGVLRPASRQDNGITFDWRRAPSDPARQQGSQTVAYILFWA